MYCPRALAIAALRAAPGPAFACDNSTTRGSLTFRTRSAVSSVEPSSTMMSSKSSRVWAMTEPIAGTIVAAALCAAMTTLKLGSLMPAAA